METIQEMTDTQEPVSVSVAIDSKVTGEDILVKPDCIVHCKEEEYLIVYPQIGRWFRTSELGKWFVDQCDGHTSLEQVYQALAREKGMLLSQAEMLLTPFVTGTLREGFVKKGTQYLYPQITPPDEASLEALSSVWIHGTLKCNLHCFFCYSSSGEQSGPELKAEDLQRFLAQIPHPGNVTFNISGGEPFLWSELEAAVKTIKELGGRITLLTNGTVGTAEDYQKVLPFIDQLQFSIDGVSAATHDLHRGAGAFEKVMARITMAKEIGVKMLTFSFTPSRHNVTDLPQMFDFTQSMGAQSLHVNRLMPVGRGMATQKHNVASVENYTQALDELLTRYHDYIAEEVRAYQEESVKIGFRSENNPLSLINLDIAGDQSRKVAMTSLRTTCGTIGMLSIDADGSVYSCPSIHLPELRLGSITEQTLEEIWEARKPFLKKTHVDALPSCRECAYRYICGGGCRAATYGHTGDLYGCDPICEEMQAAIINCMWQLRV